MNERNIENLPYYKRYEDVKNSSFTIHASDEFIKDLRIHLKNKYPDLLNKKGKNKGKHNFGASARLILEDYLNHQCTIRDDYEYKIISLLSENQYGNGDIGVFNVIKRKFSWDNGLIWNNKEHESYFNENFTKDELKQLEQLVIHYADRNNCDADDVHVFHFGLNNHLDKFVDGVYCSNDSDKRIHCGVTLMNSINLEHDSYCIVYSWCVDADYKPKIIDISFETVNKILNDLAIIGNYVMYNRIMSDLYKHEKKYPSDEIKRLEMENKRIEDKIEELKATYESNSERLNEIKS